MKLNKNGLIIKYYETLVDLEDYAKKIVLETLKEECFDISLFDKDYELRIQFQSVRINSGLAYTISYDNKIIGGGQVALLSNHIHYNLRWLKR